MALIIGVIIVFIFSKIVPYHMDEFAAYHPIMCLYYKANLFNNFRESCSAYNLNFINSGLILPLRANYYVGSFQAILYLPLFILWKSPLSARFLGYIFLLLQAIILGKIFKIKFEYLLGGFLIFFPYFFQHIVDTGPISYQTTSIFLIYFLILKWIKNLKISYLIVITLLIFCGIFTKLSYFWLLPGLLLIFGWEIYKNKKSIFKYNNFRKLCLGFSFALLIFTLLFYFLFLSTNPSDSQSYPLIDEITKSPRSSLYTLSELKEIKIFQMPIIKALINPLEATQRIYANRVIEHLYIYDFFIFILLPFILIILLYKGKIIFDENIGDLIIFYLSFIITIFFIMATKQAIAMHHLILAYPFLILFSLKSINILKNIQFKSSKTIRFQTIIIPYLALFCILNIYLYSILPKQTIDSQSDFSLIDINKILNNEQLARDYLFVVVDGGMYYSQALYGNINQSVIYIQPLDTENEIQALKDLSRENNRKLLFIYNQKRLESDMNLVRKSFVLDRCKLISESSVWDILLEKNNSRNICFN